MSGFIDRVVFFWYTSSAFKKVGALGIILMLFSIPVAVFMSGQSQEIRSRASGEQVEFTLSPATDTKSVGDVIETEITINAGSFDVSAVDITVTFSPSFLSAVSFTKSNSIAHSHIERPNDINNTAGTMRIAMVNPGTTPHRGSLTLGKIRFNATAAGSATVGITQARVTAAGESGSLSTNLEQSATYTVTTGSTRPTEPLLSPNPTVTPTSVPGVSPTAFPPTATIAPTATRAPTPTPLTQQTPVNFSFKLGETDTGLERTVVIEIFDLSGNQKFTKTIETAPSEFQGSDKSYTSRQSIDTTAISTGSFTIKAKPAGFLAKAIPGIYTLDSLTTANALPSVTFTLGDINNDNKIDVTDYNALLGCYEEKITLPDCSTIRSIADYNNDGRINDFDINRFIRSMSRVLGD